VRIRLGIPLDRICYQSGKPGLKQVDYWGGTVLEAHRRAPDAEVDVVSWLPVRAALSRLTFAHDHFLVQQYIEQPQTTPLLIVRHAKAMDRKDWSKKDAARPINARGRRQAGLLVPMLGAYGVTRLVSSSSSRCVATLVPYARDRELTIQRHDKLSEEDGAGDPNGVAKLVRKVRDDAVNGRQPTVLCVHRPVLPHVLEALDLTPTTLVTGEFLVAHLTADGTVEAVERHRPLA
jgi:phosphohistidine phosphatase SixA